MCDPLHPLLPFYRDKHLSGKVLSADSHYIHVLTSFFTLRALDQASSVDPVL